MSHLQIVFFTLVLVLLIFLAAFFSCAETGLMAVNRYRLRHQARINKRSAVRLMKLLKRPDRVLGVILIGSTFTNILASSLATLLAFHYWGDKGAILAAVVLTFIVLIFAEITPKTLAAIYADKIALWVSYPIQVILKLCYPIVWLANAISNGLLRLLHIKVTNYSVEPVSREELRSVVYDTTGKISRQYQNMLLSILDLNKLRVEDIMVPRHEIKGIDLDDSWEKILTQLNQFHQEWIPVFQTSINQLQGVIYTRDILRVLLSQSTLNKQSLRQFLHEPYFVPEGTSLYSQLGYFQQSEAKIAFIVDEYGEILGLLTLNDILKEIIGDFTSSVRIGKRVTIQPDGSYLIDGAITIREFNRITGWELPLGPRTINGLIIEYLEALPHTGICILIGDYPIEIIQVKDNRVKLAKIAPKLRRKENH